MAYIKVPSDLGKIKNKVAIGMTGRQLICIGTGLAVAIPTMFTLRMAFELENNMSLVVLMITLAPFAILAFFEKDGLFFEDVMRHRLRKMFYFPRRRLYKQENRYEFMIWAQKQIDEKIKRERNNANGKKTKRAAPSTRKAT